MDGVYVENYDNILQSPAFYDLPYFFKSPASASHITRLGDSKLVISYRFVPIMQILDLESNEVTNFKPLKINTEELGKEIVGDDFIKYTPIVGKSISYFIKTYSTESKAYLLYSGRVFDPLKNPGSEGSQLLAIDEIGKTRLFSIPLNVTAFAVDNSDKYLYCIALNENEDEYFKFKLDW